MSKKAAIYCRISSDREGLGLGVKRQEEDCIALAERLGWEVVGIYVDNDLSAYSGKKRPEYQRMLEDIKSGHADAIVSWHADRLHRSPKELEEFILICEEKKVDVSTVQAGYVDLTTPGGRMNARIIGGMARYESEIKSERLKRKALQSAQAGKLWGRGTRPFGFENDSITVNETEAEVIRDLADRFLAGESLNSLARSLADRGIKTTLGNTFGHQQVRRMLRGGRWSGQREYHGEIISLAEWPAIIDPEKQRLIREVLDAPERKNERKSRRYLLSGGLIVCGTCNQTMISHPREGVRRYICRKDPVVNTKACGRMYIKAEWVEEAISEGVLLRLANPAFGIRLSQKSNKDNSKESIVHDYKKLLGREAELAELFAEGSISKSGFATASKKLQGSIKRLETELNKYAQNEVIGINASKASEALYNWGSLNLDQQKSVIKLVLDKVVITQGRAGYNRLDLGRINPVWKF